MATYALSSNPYFKLCCKESNLRKHLSKALWCIDLMPDLWVWNSKPLRLWFVAICMTTDSRKKDHTMTTCIRSAISCFEMTLVWQGLISDREAAVQRLLDVCGDIFENIKWIWDLYSWSISVQSYPHRMNKCFTFEEEGFKLAVPGPPHYEATA